MVRAPEINTNVAHTARVYDYWLGGKDNFPAYHALAEAILEAVPSMRAMARANRAFLGRAVRYLAADPACCISRRTVRRSAASSAATTASSHSCSMRRSTR